MDNEGGAREVPPEIRQLFSKSTEGDEYVINKGKMYVSIEDVRQLVQDTANYTLRTDGATPTTAIVIATLLSVYQALEVIESELMLVHTNEMFKLDNPPDCC